MLATELKHPSSCRHSQHKFDDPGEEGLIC